MKYITTDKHPELKEGIMLEYSAHGQQYYTGSNMYHATHHQVKALLEKGYIKEVEEKKYTLNEIVDLDVLTLDDAIKLVNKWMDKLKRK